MSEARENNDALMPIMLVGNKSDLEHKREILTEDGLAYAKENNLLFIETSAKTAHNVEEVCLCYFFFVCFVLFFSVIFWPVF